MNDSDERPATTQAKVSQYEVVSPLLGALFQEIQTLSKKKPEGTLNTSKVKLINRILVDVKELLSEEANIKYLDTLDDELLPQYSDVVLVLSLFSSALGAFHSRYRAYSSIEHEHYWVTE